MGRYYEKSLPEGYREAQVIDACDKKLGSRLAAASSITITVLFTVIAVAYVVPRYAGIAAGFSVLKCLGLIVSYVLYVIIHELTHGLVYKVLTGQKLTFGVKPPTAYCGVPDIYCYRITSLLSLAAPFTFLGILLAALFFAVTDPFVKTLVLVLLVLHISGCMGDLYGIRLFLFRYRDPATLRKDTGPKMIYYTRDGTAD